MKPVELILSGWGPYRDKQQICFEGLWKRGIFLITGQTGAGKTTVFDAITYALYGDLSGSMREKDTVRSDFADVDTETYVEFTMEHDGQRYKIYRNPEYRRPKKRKRQGSADTVEREKALLFLPDGKVLEGNREVNAKVRELLRLDVRQFKQISMIAQGEFARLLTANADEKTKIFREIFGTSVCDTFTRRLKERTGAQEKQAMEYLHRMEEDVRLFTAPEERYLALTKNKPYPFREVGRLLEELAGEYEEQIEALSGEEARQEEQVRAATADLALVEEINGQLARLQKQKQRLAQLEGQQERMEVLEQKLQRASAAGKVWEVETLRREAAAGWEREKQRMEVERQEMVALKKRQEQLERLAVREEETEQYFLLLEDLVRAERDNRELQKTLKERKATLEREQKRYLQAEKEEAQKYESWETLQRRFERAMIGIVAGMVREGQPCPVCGSLTHPQVACPTGEEPTREEVEKKRREMEAAGRRKLECHGDARVALEGWETAVEEEKATQERLQELATLEKERYLGLKEVWRIIGLQKESDEAIGDLQRKLPLWRNRFREQVRLLAETQAALSQKSESIERGSKDLALTQARCTQLAQQVEERRKEQGFALQEDWVSYVLSPKEREEGEGDLRRYREERKSCRELVAHLERQLQDKEPVEVEGLHAQLKEMTDRKKELAQKKQEYLLRLESARRTFSSLQKNLKHSRSAQEKYGLLKELENMALGNNAKRLVFEQYVLAGYFEEILQAANLRLKRMSGGRYELFRVEQVNDGRRRDNLEIEVLDYYTGKRRSVRTLSGGEAFKASLSLALGLSDTVQAFSGGVKVETLFIDEGFGALDSQSLDQASDTLMALASADRLIGVISHVPELKERIRGQIIVDKKKTGSSIRVGV